MSRQPGAVPWSSRLFESVPLPPFWVGMGLAVAMLGAYLGFEYATGRLGHPLVDGESREIRGLSATLLMLAYLATAQVYLARWTHRHIEQLRPLVRGDAGLGVGPAYPARASRAAGAAGSLLFVGLFLFAPLDVYSRREGHWTFGDALSWVLIPCLGWMIARFCHAIVFDARCVSRLAADLRGVDLIDTSPLAPFVQQGLLSALLVFLQLGIGLSGFVGQSRTTLLGSLVTFAAMVGVGVAALVLPVIGVRNRIREEKSVQLAALRDRISADRQTVLAGGPHLDQLAARLPGLLALEARLHAVREWPFDLSSLLRFGLYVTLGLGSWLGGAAVERLLDLALD